MQMQGYGLNICFSLFIYAKLLSMRNSGLKEATEDEEIDEKISKIR